MAVLFAYLAAEAAADDTPVEASLHVDGNKIHSTMHDPAAIKPI
jgi:hypothetical protein